MQNREKLGRRAFGKTLATTAAGALVSSEAPAQNPPADTVLSVARQNLRETARSIAQVPLPRTVEPAVHFKA